MPADLADALSRAAARLLSSEEAPARARHAASFGTSPECFRASLEASLRPWREAGRLVAPPGRPRPRVLLVLPASAPAAFLSALPHLLSAAGEVVVKLSARGPEVEASIPYWVASAVREAGLSDPPVHFFRAARGDAKVREEAAKADRIVVFGTDEAVRAFEAMGPAIGYGHRFSLGLALEPSREAARAFARDAVLWEGRGCLSPQVVFVSGDAARAEAFAALLAEAMEETEAALPAPRRTKAEAGLALSYRANAAVGAGALRPRVFGPPDFAWTVVFDPRDLAGAPVVSPPAFRIVVVRPLSRPDALGALLGASRAHLEALGVFPPGENPTDLPDDAVLPAGAMQSPSLFRCHGGRPPLTALLSPAP